jgi:hypothetical protein
MSSYKWSSQQNNKLQITQCVPCRIFLVNILRLYKYTTRTGHYYYCYYSGDYITQNYKFRLVKFVEYNIKGLLLVAVDLLTMTCRQVHGLSYKFTYLDPVAHYSSLSSQKFVKFSHGRHSKLYGNKRYFSNISGL